MRLCYRERQICPVGTIPDPTAVVTCKNVYVEGIRQCIAYPPCIKDPCFGITDNCKCDYSKCIFASSAASNIRGCITPTADLFTSVSAEVFKAPPSTCVPSTTGDTKPPTTEPVDKIGAVVNTPDKVSAAIDQLNTDLNIAKTVVDVKTGANLAAEFSVIVVAIAYPEKNTDGSVKMSVLASFLPTGAVVTKVTEDHQRIYCPIIVKLLANVGGFSISDMRNTCTWTKQASVKRQTGSESETFKIDSDASSQSVSSIYGSSAGANHQTISFFLVAVLVIMSLFLF